jgi:hypothetical protein
LRSHETRCKKKPGELWTCKVECDEVSLDGVTIASRDALCMWCGVREARRPKSADADCRGSNVGQRCRNPEMERVHSALVADKSLGGPPPFEEGTVRAFPVVIADQARRGEASI